MLETEDLILRYGQDSDCDALYKNLWSQISVFRYLFSRPSSSPEAGKKKTEAYIEMHQQARAEFFVIYKSTMEPIGIAGIKQLSPEICTVTDIAIGPSFSRKGYGKQILSALTELAFSMPGIKELHYSCFSENNASKNLALSCGFAYSHSQEAELPKDGKSVILDHYIRRNPHV